MFKTITKYAVTAVLVSAVLAPAAFAAAPHEAPMRALADSTALSWLADPLVVEAIKAQNTRNVGLSQKEIIKMDKQWRAEVKGSGGPLIDEVLANSLSNFLKTVKADSKGMFTEIFVMDNKGLNVGQSDVTSDYWQGDEAKWQKTYLVGANQIHIGKVKMDESTQTLQSQLSISIVDPASKKVIGAVTVGVNVDELAQ